MGKKSRRPRSTAAAPSGGSAPHFSQVPLILQIVQNLAGSGQIPREAVFYAVHHLLDLEKKHSGDPGFHALSQGQVAEADIHRFVQTTLQIMTHHHQQMQKRVTTPEGDNKSADDDASEAGSAEGDATEDGAKGAGEGEAASEDREGAGEGEAASEDAEAKKE